MAIVCRPGHQDAHVIRPVASPSLRRNREYKSRRRYASGACLYCGSAVVPRPTPAWEMWADFYASGAFSRFQPAVWWRQIITQRQAAPQYIRPQYIRS